MLSFVELLDSASQSDVIRMEVLQLKWKKVVQRAALELERADLPASDFASAASFPVAKLLLYPLSDGEFDAASTAGIPVVPDFTDLTPVA